MAGVPRGWSIRWRSTCPSASVTDTSHGLEASGDAVSVASTEIRPHHGPYSLIPYCRIGEVVDERLAVTESSSSDESNRSARLPSVQGHVVGQTPQRFGGHADMCRSDLAGIKRDGVCSSPRAASMTRVAGRMAGVQPDGHPWIEQMPPLTQIGKSVGWR